MRIPITIFAVLLAFQASAQTENKVTVAGRAWASIENVEVTGATNPNNNVRQRSRVSNDSSYVRIRGDMKLADELSAWGQIESQFAIDGGAATPFDSGRNTGVGLTHKGFGTITLGRWDSPYKLSTIQLDPWGNTTINNYAAIMGGFHSTGNLYDARLGNGVQYWSPSISGFQVRAAAMVNEDRTNAISPHVLSFSATYDGPIYVAAAYETRRNCTGANAQGAQICAGETVITGATSGRDWGVRVGAGINLKPTNTEIGAVYEHLESGGSLAVGERKLKRDAYYGSLVQGLGSPANQIVAAVGVAAKASGDFLANNDNTAALYWTAAFRHNFNKDLMVYAAYVMIQNDDVAVYRFPAPGLAVAGAAANVAGGSYKGFNAGARYLF